jgi:hypothetical protein
VSLVNLEVIALGFASKAYASSAALVDRTMYALSNRKGGEANEDTN